MNNKGFAPILVILLIVVFGFAGFLIYNNQVQVSNYQTNLPTPSTLPLPSQTPDPTAGWEKYNNQTLGFSFKYPKGWRVNTFQNNGDYNRGFTLVNEKDQEILTMYDSPPAYWVGCEDIPSSANKTIQFGNEKIVNTCRMLKVMIPSGKQFNMEFRYFNSSSISDGSQVLKTIEGLSIVPSPKNPLTYSNEYYALVYPPTWGVGKAESTIPVLSSMAVYNKSSQSIDIKVTNQKIDIPDNLPGLRKTEDLTIDGINTKLFFYDNVDSVGIPRHDLLVIVDKNNLHYNIVATFEEFEGNKFDDFKEAIAIISGMKLK